MHLARRLLSCLIVLILTAGPVAAQTINFEELDTDEETRQLPDLLQKKQTLWTGKTETLVLETGILSSELLTVSATSNKLHVNTGQSLNLLNGELEETLPGRILYLDLHSARDHPNIALMTVTLLSQETLRTRVFSLRQDPEGNLSLNDFYRSNWSLIRPVGDRMLRQQYDAQSRWVDEVQEMNTTRSGYQPGESLELPSGSRLYSLTPIGDDRWSYVDANGALTLLENGSVSTKIKGNFSSTAHKIQPARTNWQQGSEAEPIRLPPVVLDERNTLAVMYNPNPTGGLMGWIYGGSASSSIELFSLDEGTLQFAGSIGPLRSRVLDVEVPEANPNQLLWLRRSGRNEVSLEMIDFSSIDEEPTG